MFPEVSEERFLIGHATTYNGDSSSPDMRMSHPFFPFPNERPICPVDALPDPLRDAVLHAIQKGFPPGVALTDAIAAVAALVHCAYDAVTPDGERMATTVSTCSTADSASGKGRSMRQFFKHMLTANARPRAPDVSSRRAPTHTMAKPSFRALIDALEGYGMNLTIQREEGASFLQTDLFKKDTDALAQLWSGDPPLDHIVHGKLLVANGARCSLGFRIQPYKMDEHLNGAGRGSYRLGLWPRTIASCHDPEKFPGNETYVYRGSGSHSTVDYDLRMLRLSSHVTSFVQSTYKGRIPVELDGDAKAFLLELGYRIKQWKKPYFGDIREAAGRAWENTLRVTVVMHVFCIGEGKVSRDYVERAWAIVEWSLSQHRLIFVESPRTATGAPLTAMASPMRQVRMAQSKPPKVPRPHQDAQWFLNCLVRLWLPTKTLTVYEVNQLAALPQKRLVTALKWLELEGLVRLTPNGSNTLIMPIVASHPLTRLGY